ncbi:MAG TPA: hypothetical protein VD971_02525 [Phycisphaerales bacterium]|nr:hypothetical protein [Phycisphaerales bacterium]
MDATSINSPATYQLAAYAAMSARPQARAVSPAPTAAASRADRVADNVEIKRPGQSAMQARVRTLVAARVDVSPVADANAEPRAMRFYTRAGDANAAATGVALGAAVDTSA